MLDDSREADEARSSPRGAATTTSQLVFQLSAFAAIGVFGFVVDAAITYLCAKYLGLGPVLARPPGFTVATIANFALNRSVTFHGSSSPIVRAFLRYCLVASAGLVVNYATYSACVLFCLRLGIAVTPSVLPLFVAVGTGVAMSLTFLGFRQFAFR